MTNVLASPLPPPRRANLAGWAAVLGGVILASVGAGAAGLPIMGIALAATIVTGLAVIGAIGILLLLGLAWAIARPGIDGTLRSRRLGDGLAMLAVAAGAGGAALLAAGALAAGPIAGHAGFPLESAASPGAPIAVAASEPPSGGATCPASLQGLVDGAADGAVVTVPACLYRETVTIDHPMTLRAEPGAEIRGSDRWTGWTRSDGGWDSALQVEAGEARGTCARGTDRCHVANQVFLDGAALRFASGDRPGPGAFSVLPGGTIRLGNDPAAREVEVSTRQLWVHVTASDVTVEGFVMRHSTVQPQAGGITVGGFGAAPVDRVTIRGCHLSDAHGALLSIQGGSDQVVEDNTLERGGQLGLHLSGEESSGNWLVARNVIRDNATDGFDMGWEAGGLKALNIDGLRIVDNEFAGGPDGDNGRGAWTDTGTRNIVFTGNRMHDNGYEGAMFESSHGLRVEDNVAWDNGAAGPDWAWGGGIVLSSSDHALVRNNLVAWNADGISVVSQDRTDDLAHEGIVIEDNTILAADRPGDPEAYALAWVQDWAGSLCAPASGNTGSANRVWAAHADARAFAWCGPALDIAAFAGVPGGAGTQALATADAMALAAAAGVPWTPEAPVGMGPALEDAGTRLAGLGLLVAALVGLVRRRSRPGDALWRAALPAAASALPPVLLGGPGTAVAIVAGSGWAAAGAVAILAGRRSRELATAPGPGEQVPH